MTQAQWRACEDPFRLLRFLRAGRWWRGLLPRWLDPRRPNARKMRLLACAYERMDTPANKQVGGEWLVLATAERYADGEATLEELRDRTHDPEVVRLAACDDEIIPTFEWWERNWSDNPIVYSSGITRTNWATRRVKLCRLLRCIFNPFRSRAARLLVLTPDVAGLARTIYDERTFDLMPSLADALMNAGCSDDAILAHCRNEGPHFRGCWAIDLILGKE